MIMKQSNIIDTHYTFIIYYTFEDCRRERGGDCRKGTLYFFSSVIDINKIKGGGICRYCNGIEVHIYLIMFFSFGLAVAKVGEDVVVKSPHASELYRRISSAVHGLYGIHLLRQT